MKIVALETHIVAVPPPHIGGMYWLFVKLKTDCGIEGVGEIYAATFGPKAMLPIIEDVFERYLLNHDPHHIERFFRQAYSSGFTQRPDLTMMGVVSGHSSGIFTRVVRSATRLNLPFSTAAVSAMDLGSLSSTSTQPAGLSVFDARYDLPAQLPAQRLVGRSPAATLPDLLFAGGHLTITVLR